ncbi:MAG: Hemolysin-type calcium-binding region [Alphaproteobacteria bacterium]|jgi:hypothetical protein|nr:Hemolysin-type calcium-binding region [Alphaproteobacteria bacterium]
MTLPKKRTLMIALLMATSFSQGGQGMDKACGYQENPTPRHYSSSAGVQGKLPRVTTALMYGAVILSRADALWTYNLGPQFQINQNSLISGVGATATAGLNNGNIAIAWPADNNQIVFRIFAPDGTPITNESNASATPLTSTSYPSIIGCNNNFAVTWGAGPILARIFSTSGTAVTSPFIVNQTSYTSMGTPTVGCLTNGNFVFGWAVSSVGNYQIPGRIFSSIGTAITSEFNFNQITTNFQGNPFVLGLSNGDFFVNWYSGLTGNYRTVGRLFLSDGTAKGNEFTINQNVTAPTGGGISAQLTNGNIITIYPDGITNMLGRVTQNGAPVGNAFQVPNNTVTQLFGGFIASLTNANAALTLLSDGNIQGRFFDASGTALMNQFTISDNNPFQNGQGSQSVAKLTNGNAFATWLDTTYNTIVGRTVSLINTTDNPTGMPTTVNPTRSPTPSPTGTPNAMPTTAVPTSIPTTLSPTGTPNTMPTTAGPTSIPTSLSPTGTPNAMPTTANPTSIPTSLSPTGTPNTMPTTVSPTRSPTRAPTTSSASRLTPGWWLPTTLVSQAFKAVVGLFQQ